MTLKRSPGDHFGPLLRQNGEMIPLAPLLRTRDTLPNGIIRAAWTLYQPHALIWNYAFWNGKANFAQKMAVGTKNIPQCQWESIIPHPLSNGRLSLGYWVATTFKGVMSMPLSCHWFRCFILKLTTCRFASLKNKRWFNWAAYKTSGTMSAYRMWNWSGNIAPKRVWQLLPSSLD